MLPSPRAESKSASRPRLLSRGRSDETRSFVNQLRAKQDAFMRHLEAHGLHIPGLHETGPMPGTSFAETKEALWAAKKMQMY